MRFSDKFDLIGGQAGFDFIDVSLETDLQLFLDPYALTLYPTDWCRRAHATAHEFFQRVLTLLRSGDRVEAERLVDKLREDNRTRLGYSKGKPLGTGMGPKKAEPFLDTLENSEAFQSGQIEDIADYSLLVPDVGPDTVSDILTNVIRELLVEYTVDQCGFYGIPLTKQEQIHVWDTADGWVLKEFMLPECDEGKAVILVPRAIVRRSPSLDTNDYIRDIYDQYDSGSESATRTLEQMLQSVPTKGKKGTKVHRGNATKKIDESTQSRKDFAARYAAANPQSVAAYRRKARQDYESMNASDIEKVRPDRRNVELDAIISEMHSARANAATILEAVVPSVGALITAMHPILQHPRLAETGPAGFACGVMSTSAISGSWRSRNMSQNVLVLTTSRVVDTAVLDAADLGAILALNASGLAVVIAPTFSIEVGSMRQHYATEGIYLLTSEDIGDVLAQDHLPEDAAEHLYAIATGKNESK